MDLRTAIAEIPLLPTPAVNDMGAAYTPETWDEWTATMKAKHNNGNGHGPSLNVEVQRMLLPTPHARDGKGYGPADMEHKDPNLSALPLLLPTPSVADSTGGHERRGGERGEELLLKGNWGEYEPAIRRWEALTRPAPAPTRLNAKGNPKLSDEFDEWFMGYPAGWITDVPGVTWNETLKACGNGVMPQQGAEAIRFLLERVEVAA
jgi:DNA (cytosine-5)-methyltransferase 1